jgi:hypothetical protein
MTEPIKVLLLASDPRGNLRLDREARGVTDAIRRAKDRDSLQLVLEWAVTIHNLQDVLLTHTPTIVHFAGHASETDGIYLCDAHGRQVAVDSETLLDLFGILKGFVRVVVLNACQTLATAEKLREVVDYTVGMDALISDPAAAIFAEAFYGALASGMTVQKSFQLGRNRLRMEFKGESHIPQLLIRDGVDADGRPAVVPGSGPDARRSDELRYSAAAPQATARALEAARAAVEFASGCFPGLASGELRAVVQALLAHTSPEAAVPVGGTAQHGREQLLRFWRENADRILEETGTAGGPGASLPAANARRGNVLALPATDSEPLASRVHALHQAGFLFGSSESIAEGLVRISTEAAARDPAAFDGKWLLGVLARADGASPATLQRFSALLRGFCGDAALSDAVDTVFEELVRTHAFPQALCLAEQLLDESGFDALAWLRRMVDCDDAAAGAAVHRLLLNQLADATRVYPLLRALWAWLPPTGPDDRTCSRSNLLAVRVLPEFALSAASCLDVAAYGGWPSRYPLFASMRREKLAEQVSLLIRWILHPALSAVFGVGETAEDEAGRIVATLIAEWTFILCGDTGLQPVAGATGSVDIDPRLPLTAAEVLAAVLAELDAQTRKGRNRRLRKVCVTHWAEMSQASAELIPVLGRTAGPLRDQITWKQGLLRALASQGLPDGT